MGGHGRQLSPRVRLRVEALHGIQRLQSVPATHEVQFGVEDCHAELEPSARHRSDGRPSVRAKIKPLNARRS